MLERVLGWSRTRPVDARGIWPRAIALAAVVTGLVTVVSAFLPDKWVATFVGLVFFGATWMTVWHGDDELVLHHGLAFAGLVLPGRLDFRKIGRETLAAAGWAAALAAVCFIPFFLGFRAWATFVWHIAHPFQFRLAAAHAGTDVLAQVLIVALPEEAFYRGYLQTRLDDAWPSHVRILGANVGPSLLVTSAIFALGHFATIHDPARLAVFFPSLAFGWLRARTGGVGAPVAFHAMCNLLSESLMRGFGL